MYVSKLKKLYIFVLGALASVMAMIIIALHFLIPISIWMIVFDVLLVIGVLIPIFIPEKYANLSIFKEHNYKLLSQLIIVPFEIIIIWENWPIVKEILQHLMR